MSTRHEMQRRQKNESSLKDWLNNTWPSRFGSRLDPDTQVRGKAKLDGSDPLNVTNTKRLDDESQADTDAKLRELFFVRLPKHKHPLFYTAAREWLLYPNAPGGYVVLERLESGSTEAKAIGSLCRAAFEYILDELEREDFTLNVPIDKAPKLRDVKTESVRQNTLRDVYAEERRKVSSDSEAIRATVKRSGYSRSQVERLTVDMRKEGA